MSYRLIENDPDFDTIRFITAVLFTSDGSCLAQPGDPTLSTGKIRPGEHALLEAPLRIALETHRFRMQRVHSVAVEGQADALHWYCFLEGSAYSGRRPHAKVRLGTFTPEGLAERFERTRAHSWARAVRDATRSYRTQDDQSVLTDNLRLLEPCYLHAQTPQGQSGFGGTAQDWRPAREPVVEGMEWIATAPSSTSVAPTAI